MASLLYFSSICSRAPTFVRLQIPSWNASERCICTTSSINDNDDCDEKKERRGQKKNPKLLENANDKVRDKMKRIRLFVFFVLSFATKSISNTVSVLVVDYLTAAGAEHGYCLFFAAVVSNVFLLENLYIGCG